jgi:hypothetical protein
LTWGAPGLKNIQGSLNSVGGFRILDETMDAVDGTVNTSAEHTFVSTTIPGASLPPWPGTLLAYSHPCSRVRFTNVTGCDLALQLSLPGAYDRPLFSYSLWTCSGLSGNSVARQLWGWVKSIKVNVTSAAAGTLQVLSQFGNFPVILADYSRTTFAPTVDLSVAGLHTITLPQAMWFTGYVTPFVDPAAATTAHFTIEIVTNPSEKTFVCTFA